MAVTSVGRLVQSLPNVQQKTLSEATESFKSILNSALNQVETLQRESDIASQRLASGQAEDIHQVVIAGEKATLSLQLAIAVRNKMLEAYQEVMRMQV